MQRERQILKPSIRKRKARDVRWKASVGPSARQVVGLGFRSTIRTLFAHLHSVFLDSYM